MSEDRELEAENLEPCPFCGEAPELIEGALSGIPYAECQNSLCLMNGFTVMVSEWNRRALAKDEEDGSWHELPKEERDE